MADPEAKILVVEDDDDLGSILCSELVKAGFEVMHAQSGTEGRLLLDKKPDLILMDLMLPGMSGEELLTHVKDNTPVIAVTSRSSIDDKVELLSRGCVDYITKPFNIRELLARVKAALRVSRMHSEDVGRTGGSYVYGDLKIDDEKMVTEVAGKEVRLTRTEYAILKKLMQSEGRVISKSELLDLIREDTPDCVDSSLKVHISNLRRKLKETGGKDYIEAVWGIGFKLAEP